MQGRLVIAVHDVAPSTLEEVRYLLHALDEVSARPRVLKVIPKDVSGHPALIRLLRDEQANGSEIVAHGFTHQTDGRLLGPWPARLRAQLFAARDAEFVSLTSAEMAQRVLAGRKALQDAGLAVAGFCAPGWLAPPEVRGVLKQSGFRYYVGMASVLDLQTGRRVWTDWLGYMGAGGVQEPVVGIANRVNRALAPLFQVVKVFLHPQGAVLAPACRRVIDVLPTLMKNRRIVTYGQLLSV